VILAPEIVADPESTVKTMGVALCVELATSVAELPARAGDAGWPKVIIAAAATITVRVTEVAALYVELPAWLAVIKTVPEPGP